MINLIGETIKVYKNLGRYFVGYCGSQPAYDNDYEDIDLEILDVQVDYSNETITLEIERIGTIEIAFVFIKELTLKEIQNWFDNHYDYNDWCKKDREDSLI